MKYSFEKVIRPHLKNLQPYKSARDEFQGEASIFLDANENAFGSVSHARHNRYPDPYATKLRERVSDLRVVSPEKIIVGNGSDEIIDLLFRAFCTPGVDNVIVTPPSYGMYEVSANIHGVEVKKALLNEDYQIDAARILAAVTPTTKIIFLCSPNNPTGNVLKKDDMITLLEQAPCIVAVDEAYIDFCTDKSILGVLDAHPNLVVSQTLSKAWGLAEIRLGVGFAHPEIISLLRKIKAPYNVNGITQNLAIHALRERERFEGMIQEIIREREYLAKELSKIPEVVRVFPSDANFLLVKFQDAGRTYEQLAQSGVIARNRSHEPLCENSLRITVGTRQENDALLLALTGKLSGKKVERAASSLLNTSEFSLTPRIEVVTRKTSETEIVLTLNLDGTGRAKIETGLGFFDHMLTQIARHSGCDLTMKVTGDLHVDEHHTIEDAALALGESFRRALGDKCGVTRYGFVVPMDEAEARVSLDFSGRNWIVWKAEFKREKIGEMPTEMFYHFFKSFSDAALCTLHIEVSGENEHHKIEAIFKAFARALGQAIRRDPLSMDIPSTKGVL